MGTRKILTVKGCEKRLARGRETRARFVASHIDKGIAFQLRSIRDARGLSQVEAARLAGMEQANVSRMENPYYGKHTLTALKRLAAVYDIGLSVEFVPFSKLIRRVTGITTSWTRAEIKRSFPSALAALPGKEKK
jgi:transcriptional regulator with XRE-family HTH domain